MIWHQDDSSATFGIDPCGGVIFHSQLLQHSWPSASGQGEHGQDVIAHLTFFYIGQWFSSCCCLYELLDFHDFFTSVEFLDVIISKAIIAGLENFLGSLKTRIKVNGSAPGRDHLLDVFEDGKGHMAEGRHSIRSHPLFGDKFEEVLVRAKV